MTHTTAEALPCLAATCLHSPDMLRISGDLVKPGVIGRLNMACGATASGAEDVVVPPAGQNRRPVANFRVTLP